MERIPPRRTKIMATLGPSTDDDAVLTAMIEAGLNLVRINMSHGDIAVHQKRLEQVERLKASLEQPIGVLADLQGPKLRIARFVGGRVDLTVGDTFVIDPNLPSEAGTAQGVGTSVMTLADDVAEGDTLLLDDGRIQLKVERIQGQAVHTSVLVGGEISDLKGLNRQGGGLSAETFTGKDKADIAFLAKTSVDYVALSFVKSAEDIEALRQLWKAEGAAPKPIVAKIETTEAIENLESIVRSADAVMVARGDLGVEIGFAELPGVQKNIIHLARSMDKAVITATQMMESMVHSPLPTRAEVSDVANAALDGTDAVMLSAESAVGDFPIEVIQAMDAICRSAEQQKRAKLSRHRMNAQFERVDETIAMAAMYVANHMDIRAILALTETGSTPLWMSRIRSSVPIYAFSRHTETCGRMTLYRGVHPIPFELLACPPERVAQHAMDELLRRQILVPGDRVLVTKGDILGIDGGANTLKIMTV